MGKFDKEAFGRECFLPPGDAERWKVCGEVTRSAEFSTEEGTLARRISDHNATVLLDPPGEKWFRWRDDDGVDNVGHESKHGGEGWQSKTSSCK